MTVKAHEPNESDMFRLCDMRNIPVATNIATAEVLIHGLERAISTGATSSTPGIRKNPFTRKNSPGNGSCAAFRADALLTGGQGRFPASYPEEDMAHRPGRKDGMAIWH